MKYITYLGMAIKLISAADRVQLLPTIKEALKDHKLTGSEMIDIAKKICLAVGIDLDTTGIKIK